MIESPGGHAAVLPAIIIVIIVSFDLKRSEVQTSTAFIDKVQRCLSGGDFQLAGIFRPVFTGLDQDRCHGWKIAVGIRR